MEKTNAMRLLERAGITFATIEYEVDESDLSVENTARKLGLPPETVFKTIIVRGDKSGPIFALIPGGAVLDEKRLASVSGNKRVEVVPLKEVLDLTGYIRGAVTVLAARKAYPVFIDETAQLWASVGISGGRRGLEITLSPADLVRVADARLVDIARSAS
ncbi:MAG: Cys-tRNA(Pro) deacylase [Blastocatellia bacterium]